MGAHTGRCFRDRRRTASRKRRQVAAWLTLRHITARQRIKNNLPPLQVPTLDNWNSRGKQNLIEGFKASQKQPVRRRGVM